MILTTLSLVIGTLLGGPLGLQAPHDAPAPEILVSGDWLEAHLGESDLVILQASANGQDYATAHIPGARLLRADQFVRNGKDEIGVMLPPFAELERALEAVGASDTSRLVVYGSDPTLAARLWMTLDLAGAGAGEPLFLDGGIQLWQEEGRLLTSTVPEFPTGQLTLRPDSGKVATAEWILVRLGHDGLTLLDARPTEEYLAAEGTAAGTGSPGGHIAGAHQLYWRRLVEAPDRPAFLTREELAYLFARAGVKDGDTVVTYCKKGLRASVDYLAARVLGYRARFFDGFSSNWQARGYPVRPRASEGAGSG